MESAYISPLQKLDTGVNRNALLFPLIMVLKVRQELKGKFEVLICGELRVRSETHGRTNLTEKVIVVGSENAIF